MIPSTTAFIPSGDGYQQPAESGVRGNIAEKIRRLPRVDHNGWELPPDPSDTTLAPVARTPSLAEPAVRSVAATLGIDPGVLLDSARLMTSVEAVDQSDTAAVAAAIADGITANPRLIELVVQPARTQTGGGRAVVVTPPQGSVRDRIRAETARGLSQPLPAGYIPVV